jgi:hypothetical protein
MRARLRAEVPRTHLLAFSRWICVRGRFAEIAGAQRLAAVTLTRPGG